MTRQELHDLIWSQPAKTLTPRFGISDVALSKLCQKHEIPQPARGYWAKVAAGKRVAKFPLPPRGLGIPEFIDFRRDRWGYSAPPENITELDLGPAPSFSEPIADVVSRVRSLVGKVTIPRDFSRAHHAVQAMLEEDDKRRAAYLAARYPSSFDAPFYDSPFERRRLRLTNAIAVALARQGCNPKIPRKKDPTGFSYKVGCESLGLNIDEPNYSRWGWRSEADLSKPANTTLEASIYPNVAGIQTSWKDNGDDKIENHVTEIVVMAIVAGELAYRHSEISAHDRLVSLKAYRIEEAKRAKEERDRKERERLEAERKARIDGLLSAAAKHRQANDIRAYVAAVRHGPVSADPTEVEKWALWALAQADDLDPLRSFSVEAKS